MIAITGASGQLGRLVIENLLQTEAAENLVAVVRSPEKVEDFAARGVQVRQADYNDKEALTAALSGIDKLLLISSSEVGQRASQHENVIQAAKSSNVDLIAYTSILHADTSPLPLAEEHKATEKMLAESGLPYTLLRNGWYTENYAMAAPTALQLGAVYGCAGDGRIASAARADYAAAAASVMASKENQAGKVYELAGDEAYTLSEFAATLSALSGKDIAYQNLPEADYAGALKQAGLPEPLAVMLAESDTGASLDGLYDDSHALSALIGRPTTTLQAVLQAFV